MESLVSKIQNVSLGSAMADLAMLLLIFFMTTTTADPPKSIEIDLPKAKVTSVDNESFFIAVSRTGDIYFEDEKVGLEELGQILDDKRGSRAKRINVSADAGLKFKTVSELLDLLRSHEFLNIAFMAQGQDNGNGH